MILRGEKMEEYREIKEHWMKRLIEVNAPEESKYENRNIIEDMIYDYVQNFYQLPDVLKSYYSTLATFDTVTFTNGYGKNAPRMVVECKGISIGFARAEWSDNWQGEVFIISLGKVISKTP